MSALNFDLSEPAHAVDVPADVAEALAWSQTDRGCFGAVLFYAAEVTSTNDVAARLGEAGAAEGTTVVAESQTAGRGRHGRSWWSPPGSGLYVSTILRPGVGVPLIGGAATLTLMAGVAIADGIREACGLNVEVKWPNDLVVGRRKLAGILAEGFGLGTALEYVVLGFGINLCPAVYPPDVADRATSLETELGRAVDRGVLLARSLVNLARVRDASAHGRMADVVQRWRELAPSAVGSAIEWRTASMARRGLTAGIDDDGALRVEVDGAIERVTAGEVVWL